MKSVQHPSTKPRTYLPLSLGRFRLVAPIAGYWLLAGVVVVFRPTGLQLLISGIPLVILSVVMCVRAHRRDRSD